MYLVDDALQRKWTADVRTKESTRLVVIERTAVERANPALWQRVSQQQQEERQHQQQRQCQQQQGVEGVQSAAGGGLAGSHRRPPLPTHPAVPRVAGFAFHRPSVP